MSTISPSGVNSASYTPTNSPASCPSVGSTWAAQATPLPPTPNKQLCSCMYDSLGCVVAPGVSQNNYGTLFGQVCGYGSSICAGIQANATSGNYGAYGMCNATEQLAYAFNNYYASQKSSASACSFGGSATVTSAQATGSVCSNLLQQAGTAGTGTVTSQPSGTGAVSGSSGSGSSASSSKGAAGALNVPSAETGLMPMMFIMCVALVSGFGMIML